MQLIECPTCTKDFRKDFIDMAGACNNCLMDDLDLLQDDAERKDAEVFRQLKGMVSADVYKYIEADLAESSITYNFSIVDSSEIVGEEQTDEDPIEHGHRIINQTTNGGFSGDEYAGDVFIPISPSEYFKYSYCM